MKILSYSDKYPELLDVISKFSSVSSKINTQSVFHAILKEAFASISHNNESITSRLFSILSS